MSAYGDERIISTLYTYRPASVQALGGLSAADLKREKTRIYYADLLRVVALANMKPDADLPTLTEFLTPPDTTQTAEDVYQSLIDKLKS